MNAYFGLLFARPSFLEGFARAIDIGNTMSEYNSAITPAQADVLAIRADLKALRSDLEHARQTMSQPEALRKDDNGPKKVSR